VRRLVLLLLLLAAGARAQVGPAPGYTLFQNNGTPLPRRHIANFTPAGSCVDDPGNGRTTCAMGAGGGGCANVYGIISDGTASASAVGCSDTLQLLGGAGLTDTCVDGAPDACTLAVGAGSCVTVGADTVGVTPGCVAAATATALAANGTNCTANQGAGGVDASGNAEACTKYMLGIGSSTLGRIPFFNSTDGQTMGQTVCTVSGSNITGCNIATATALAANGTNCAAGQFPLGVDASGNAETCSTHLVGLADTATALAADGTNCAANAAAGGVDASGNAQSCVAPLLTPGAVTDARLVKFSGTGGQATAQAACGETAGAITGCSLSGNATTATALAANGTNCAGGQSFALGVDASGNGECATVGTQTSRLLDTTVHTDTVAAVAPVRGDLVLANATPAWGKLAKGAAATYLRSDGTDPSWTAATANDDFTQYLKLLGRSGGQVADGGTATTEDLTLSANASDPGMFRFHGVPLTLLAGTFNLSDNLASPPTYNAAAATSFRGMDWNFNVTGMPLVLGVVRVDGTYTSGSGQNQLFQTINVFDGAYTATADGAGGSQPYNSDVFYDRHVTQLTAPTTNTTNSSFDASLLSQLTTGVNATTDGITYTTNRQEIILQPGSENLGNGNSFTLTEDSQIDIRDVAYVTRGRCVGGSNPGVLCPNPSPGVACTGGGVCTGETAVVETTLNGVRFENHASTSATSKAKHTNTNINAFRCEQNAGTGGTIALCYQETSTAPNSINGKSRFGDTTVPVTEAVEIAGNTLFDGQAARNTYVGRHATANTAGSSYTSQSGGATVAATDKDAGDYILATGLSTGTGNGKVRVQAPSKATATGTSDNVLTDRIVVTGAKAVTNNSNTSVVDIGIAASQMAGGTISFACESTDATNFQATAGQINFAGVNKAATMTCSAAVTGTNATAASSGTLAVTATATTGTALCHVQVNCNSSLTPSSGYPRITYTVMLNSGFAATVAPL
jgi:hypothetical protein